MLSFIIPTYKPNLTSLEKCVKYLKARGLQDWQAVFVFDGDCPEGIQVLKESKDKRISHITIEHGGAPRARNAGFEVSKGEYVVFWDSDCYIEPGASKLWVEILDKHKEIGLVYSGYKFSDNRFAIESHDWDPWLLRVRNYISGCFPTRRELVPKWDESLKSLQDWDFWLKVVRNSKEKGYDINKLGKYLKGYAFSTDYPTGDSISGKGCTDEVWLERMDAVRKNHDIEDRKVCVASLDYEYEGIRLAKLINADYQQFPNDKPNRYQTVIQIGFSLANSKVEKHAAIFQEVNIKKILFWTNENILEIWRTTNFENIRAYSKLLATVKQYVEDKKLQDMMIEAGFNVEIMPMPIAHDGDIPSIPDNDTWAVDVSGDFGQSMGVLEESLPDFKLVPLKGSVKLSDIVGLIHLYPDGGMSNTVKRAHLTGRHVISNIQQPYCNFVDAKETPEKLLNRVVDLVRKFKGVPSNVKANEYYRKELNQSKLLEIL